MPRTKLRVQMSFISAYFEFLDYNEIISGDDHIIDSERGLKGRDPKGIVNRRRLWKDRRGALLEEN